MQTKDYLRYIVEEIHTTIIATVDHQGLPVTSAIDMMDYDDEHLYFLTAKGKSLYDRLIHTPYISFTALKGEETMSSVAVSVRGRVQEIGPDYLAGLFAKNPYMYEIYPTEASRAALTVFMITDGEGEWFDLSKKPIERASFLLGQGTAHEEGYLITEACVGCRACMRVCPQACISMSEGRCIIDQSHCLRCGNCLRVCEYHAVERR